ncbi:MAG: AMP-binding protein [Eubacteriales bacterium]|nr:AMP-binding protein [Eubacteriales bacterium]MDD4475339.1 AMP-binding protein [Eubacteriales bacterium]
MSNVYYKIKYPKPESLRDMLKDSVAKYGDKACFRYVTASDDISSVSYNEFYSIINSLGTALTALGLPGRRIAILSESRYEWIASYITAIVGGGVVIPLDKELVKEEIANFINLAEADIIVYSSAYKATVDEIKPKLRKLDCFINLDSDFIDITKENYTSFPELSFASLLEFGKNEMDAGNLDFVNSTHDINAMCAIIFTSGTTGTSKGVMLSEKNILACINAAINMVDFSSKDEIVSVLPLHHTYETCCGILTPIYLGVTVCINNGLKYVLKNFKRFQPTGLCLVPLFVTTIYKKISDEIRKKNKEKTFATGIKITKAARKIGIDLRKPIFKEINEAFGGRLNKIICGGARLDPDMVDRFDEIGINLAQGYGITECAPLVSVNPYNKIRKESVGIPAIGCTIKIVGHNENGEEYELPTGEVGEIHVTGPNVMLGYYKNPEATAKVFDTEGYFITGDLGYVDADGYLYITGREKNVIVLNNGKNVFPEEIEEYVSRISIVKEVVVVGKENSSNDIVITALIYPDYVALEGKTPEEISELLKSEIATINKMLPLFKQIRNIEIKKNEFQKTTTQKIMRHKI